MLLIIASVVCGFMSFARAKADMAADLNQALQRTISANAEVTQMLDSLSSMADQPMLTFGARHNGFADFLLIHAQCFAAPQRFHREKHGLSQDHCDQQSGNYEQNWMVYIKFHNLTLFKAYTL
jgi:hypothetical protein